MRDDEHGFSLIETVIAIGVMFVALVTLAYAATAGFGYQALARERQAANGIADKTMEEIRGLAYGSIQKGLAGADLADDPNLVSNCPQDPTSPPITYRYPDCEGEKVTYTADPNYTPPEPLKEHVGTIEGYPTDYTYRIYITNSCPSGTETGCTGPTPYRVTVVVSWAGGRIQGVAKSVTTQSLFYSPGGCVSSQTHPYAAPCQPFFYGQAQVPRGSVTVSGSIWGLPFAAGGLFTSGVESDAQQEQFSTVAGAFMQSAALLLDTSGNEGMAGGAAQTVAASNDPSGSMDDYAQIPEQTLPATNLPPLTYGQTEFWVVAPQGEVTAVQAATAATPAEPCPPWGTSQNDEAVCSGSKIQQNGSLTAWADLTNVFENVDLDIVTFATIEAAPSPNTALVDRELVTDEDGRLVSTVERRFGTITLVGLPSGFPIEDRLEQLPLWEGYLVRMTGYTDRVIAAVGTGASNPTADVLGGTIRYWSGDGYTEVPANTTVQPNEITLVSDMSGHLVQIHITSSALVAQSPNTPYEDLEGSPAAIGEATAEMSAPLEGTISYVITIDDTVVVNLTVDVALGTMIAKGVYARAPMEG
ncbi:MAG: type II secretion system protein [Actinomycetota bacterium]